MSYFFKEKHGGTSQNSFLTGDILYASATDTLSRLAAGTDGYVLTMASGAPLWASPLPTLTSGSVLFSNGTTIAQDNSNLFWDDTNNRLGVGTTAPTAPITINRNTTATPPTLPSATATVQHLVGTDSLNAFSVYDTFAGVSGITMRRANGTSASRSAVSIFNTIGQLVWRGYGATGYLSNSVANIGCSADETFTDSAAGTSLFFSTQTSGTVAGPTLRMLISNAGNVGIGTPSGYLPTSILQFGKEATRSISIQRSTTAATAGSTLSLVASGATSGSTDKAGGDLELYSGISTGAATSSINFYAYPAGASGTTDNAASNSVSVLSSGLLLKPSSTSTGDTGRFFLRELAANGTNSVSLRAPDSIAADVTWTLPNADGTSGQVLSTNGSGTLSWATAGGGSGWALTGNSGTTAGTNFIGTTDAKDIVFKRNSSEIVRLTDTSSNTFNGYVGNTLQLPDDQTNFTAILSVPPTTTANATGTDLVIESADSNGTGNAGGLYLYSGNSQSSGNGGTLSIYSGQSTSGTAGKIELTAGNSTSGAGGHINLFAGNSTSSTAGDVFIRSGSTTTGTAGSITLDSRKNITLATNGVGAVIFPSLTTTQQNALSASNGMVIYNTTTNKLRVYANGSWVDLH